MKRVTIILLLILIALIATSAQTNIYRAHIGEMAEGGDWDNKQEHEITDKSVLVIVDYDNSEIEITNKFEDKFHITSLTESTDEDNSGNKRIFWVMSAVDKDGVKCVVLMSYFEDSTIKFHGLHDMLFRIHYPNIGYGYYCTLRSTTEI